MCAFSAPKLPKTKAPPPLAERQPIRLPDSGSTELRADDIAKRRRAMYATALAGTLQLGAPSTTSLFYGGGG